MAWRGNFSSLGVALGVTLSVMVLVCVGQLSTHAVTGPLEITPTAHIAVPRAFEPMGASGGQRSTDLRATGPGSSQVLFANVNVSTLQNGAYQEIPAVGGVHVGQFLSISFHLINTGKLVTNDSLMLMLASGSSATWGSVQEETSFTPSGALAANTSYATSIGWHVNPEVIGQQTGEREFSLALGYNTSAHVREEVAYFLNVTVYPSLLHFAGVSELPNIVGQSPSSTETWRITGVVDYNTSSRLQFPSGPPPALVGLDIHFVSVINGVNWSYAQSISLTNLTEVDNGTIWGGQVNNSFVFGLPQPSLLSAGTYDLVLVASIGGAGGQEDAYFWMTTTVGVVVPSSCTGLTCPIGGSPGGDGLLVYALVALGAGLVAILMIFVVFARHRRSGYGAGPGSGVEAPPRGPLSPGEDLPPEFYRGR